VPTTDEVVAIMAELTDPNIPAANKTDIVTPGFSPEEAGTIDDHLSQLHAGGLHTVELHHHQHSTRAE
jgi:hypothetical protein